MKHKQQKLSERKKSRGPLDFIQLFGKISSFVLKVLKKAIA